MKPLFFFLLSLNLAHIFQLPGKLVEARWLSYGQWNVGRIDVLDLAPKPPVSTTRTPPYPHWTLLVSNISVACYNSYPD